MEDLKPRPVPADMLADADYRTWIPVSLTPAAWDAAVAWTDEDTERTGVPQDETGRLWDVVWQARAGATRPAVDLDHEPQPFVVFRVDRTQDGDSDPTPVTLTITFDYDEEMQPLFMIGLPGEK